MQAFQTKPFLDEFTKKALSIAEDKFSNYKIFSNKRLPMKPLYDLAKKIIDDLNLPADTSIEKLEDDLWNWFIYVFHKGIAAAIAARYGREDISLLYSFDDAKKGKHPSYSTTLVPIDGEYSFNLRYHLFRSDMIQNDIYYDLIDLIKDNEYKIKEQKISISEILISFLGFAAIVGAELINRIDLIKDDYWPIKGSIIINDEKLQDDSDLIEVVRLGEFDEMVSESEEEYHVKCTFCGKPALILPKSGDVWNEAILDPCDHFAFAFITNTNNNLYGREYYKRSFRRSVIDYVEAYKGFTCQNNPEAFINDFLNGDTDLSQSEMDFIIKLIESELPDCHIKIKQFEKKLNGNKHVFHFHFMKFV